MVSDRLVAGISSALWFQARRSPFALLGSDLRFRAVNAAFEHVTQQRRDRLIGAFAFEAFPDNPEAPSARGVATVASSMEQVLRTATASWLGVQRYDLPHPSRPGSFLPRMWMPINLPVLEDGRVAAILHHSQDISPCPGSHARATHPADDATGMEAAFRQLLMGFPDIATPTVMGFLTDSYRVVTHALHRADVDQALSLARLRLEIHVRHPARRAPG
ncbi:MAG TPA: PAS domain-containing protein [Nocardioides sp.]|uniref:PAS domain-containing protein n=1 Tax=Nocardioides sp. TaxID=35761 RepID=UPI002D173031|nr:PAS domain-containing protein [Nocardioides sp.]HTW13844.1 PAS domain-containing protein [Nocardioides sp.]